MGTLFLTKEVRIYNGEKTISLISGPGETGQPLVKKWNSNSVGESKGGMIWENSIESCILSYVKQITSPGSMHETVRSGLVHWDDPEGWDGEGGERGIQDGEHMYTHGWFMSMCGKNHYNIVK